LIADRYLLVKLLGQGGMGFVWQAHDQVLDREVAVKEIFVPGQDDNRNTRALREARAAARLNHPGIVTVHDLVAADGRSWIVMELVAGPSLADVLGQTGPLAEDRVAEIALAMLEALQAAHDAGILHRDIKPGNVLLPGRRAVITDFGIATIQGDVRLTATGQVIGTPGYLAPERVLGEQASRASDMWAVGATLYAALTGHPPDPGAGIDAGGLTPVLERLLRRDPGDRLAADQAALLITQTMGSLAAAPTEAIAPGLTPARRRPLGSPPRLAAAGAGVAIVVAAVTLTVALSGGNTSGHDPARTASSAPARAAHPTIPAGYSIYTDSARHFSAAIPSDWLAVADNGGIRFCAPGGCPVVIFVQQLSGGSDPIVDIRSTSAANGNFPAPDYTNYRRLSLREVSYYAQAAEVEFTLHKRGTPGELHGLARVFTITNGGKEYYVQDTALSSTWHSALQVFGVFFATFLQH